MGPRDPAFWQDFWPGFWANFVADLLVGIVIAGAISWLIAKSKKIDATVTGHLRAAGPDFELRLSLRNTGKVSFKSQEIYFHILVNNTLGPTEREGKTIRSPATPGDTEYSDFGGLLERPLFPGRTTDLCTLRLKSDNIGAKNLLYFLSTAYGFFPKGIKQTEEGIIGATELGLVTLRRS